MSDKNKLNTKFLGKLEKINGSIFLLKKEMTEIKKIMKVLICEIQSIKTKTNTKNKAISESDIKGTKQNKETKQTGKKRKRGTKQNDNKSVENEFISISNSIKQFFNIKSSRKDGKIKLSYLNNLINEYILKNELLEGDRVLLNLELKRVLKTKKKVILISSILGFFLNVVN